MGEPIAGWEPVRLSEIVERRTERNSEGNTRVLTISAAQGLVDQAEYFNRIVASKDLSPYFLLERGDFAYNKSYSIGYPVGVVRRLDRYEAGVVSPLYICFRPRAGSVDSDFLEQMLRAGRLDDGIAWIAKEGARNHGLLNVGSADFFALDLELPPLDEQRRIAEILHTIDEIIQATERVIRKLQEVRRGIELDLLGGLPQQRPLGEVAEIFNGSTPSRARPEYWDNGSVPWLASGKVNDRFVTTPSDLVTPQAVRASGLQIAPRGATVVGLVGQGRTRGMCARLGISATINQNMAAVVPSAELDESYLLHEMTFRYSELRAGGRGSNQDALNCALLREFQISVPPLDRQRSISQSLDSIDQRIQAEAAVLESNTALRLGLADDLLSGRVRTVAA